MNTWAVAITITMVRHPLIATIINKILKPKESQQHHVVAQILSTLFSCESKSIGYNEYDFLALHGGATV